MGAFIHVLTADKQLSIAIVDTLLPVALPPSLPVQGSSHLFPSLVALILHHTVEPGPLPCTLSLATANPIFTEQDPFSLPDLPAAAGEGEYFHHHNYHLLD